MVLGEFGGGAVGDVHLGHVRGCQCPLVISAYAPGHWGKELAPRLTLRLLTLIPATEDREIKTIGRQSSMG